MCALDFVNVYIRVWVCILFSIDQTNVNWILMHTSNGKKWKRRYLWKKNYSKSTMYVRVYVRRYWKLNLMELMKLLHPNRMVCKMRETEREKNISTCKSLIFDAFRLPTCIHTYQLIIWIIIVSILPKTIFPCTVVLFFYLGRSIYLFFSVFWTLIVSENYA